MSRAMGELFFKELRLQRGNFIFAVGASLLGAFGLVMAASNPQAVGGFPPRDVQGALLFAGLLPALIIILPAMIGSTAAAAEKPLGVLAWQSALPVSRWRVIGIKAAVVGLLCAVVGGVFPYLLQALALDGGILGDTFRGFWTGWHALLFAAIGFFAGSFAKDDYQGLLLGLVPAVVILLALVVTDPFMRAVPFANLPLSRPWAVTVRLLLMAALLMVLATPMHGRLSTRRWGWMAGALAIAFVAGVGLTLVNIYIEAHVLGGPKSAAPKSELLDKLPAGISRAETRAVASVKRGWAPPEFNVRTLGSGQRIVTGAVHYRAKYRGQDKDDRRQRFLDNSSGTFLVIRSDGQVREFPQIFENFNDLEIAGVSANQKWVVISHKGQDVCLSGPMCVTIPLIFLPDALSHAILRGLDMDYFVSERGWMQPEENLPLGQNDVYISAASIAGFAVPGLAAKLPKGIKEVVISGHPGEGVYSAGLVTGNIAGLKTKTSTTAILRTGKTRGVLELAGFVNGEAASVSEDGQWASAGTKYGPVYRRVADSYEQAAAQPPISSGDRWTYFSRTTAPLDNGTTFVAAGLDFFYFPVIQTTSGPATIRKYATVKAVEVTTHSTQQQTLYQNVFICDDIGAEIVDLATSASHRVSLKLPTDAELRLPVYGFNSTVVQSSVVHGYINADWDQASQTLAISADGVVRLADFSDLAKGGAPKLTVAPMLDRGAIVGKRKYAHWGTRGGSQFWLSEW